VSPAIDPSAAAGQTDDPATNSASTLITPKWSTTASFHVPPTSSRMWFTPVVVPTPRDLTATAAVMAEAGIQAGRMTVS
jgi:hypothetical protein